jgi:GntR family transcriptional repressor for pyruvate dehydrogenase complex
MGQPFEVEPIRREGASERVVSRLLALITAGNLRPGDRLPGERDLAAMMAVSPPSVREALRGLQMLGVLKTHPGGGTVVSSLRPDDLLGTLDLLISLEPDNLETLTEARVQIDGGIARMAALRLTDDALERLAAMVERQERLTGDPVGFRVSDLEFHGTIGAACGNPFLDRIAASLYALGMEYRRIAAESPGVLAQSAADHRAILAALRARDPAAAEAAMTAHLRNVERSTRDAMARRAGPPPPHRDPA